METIIASYINLTNCYTCCLIVQVKEALTVLILQNIAVFETGEKLGIEYKVRVDQILKRSRYEKFVYCTKNYMVVWLKQ